MKSKKAEIRAARQSDVNELDFPTYGKSIRAYSLIIDGEVAALAGIMHTNMNQAFSVNTEKADDHPVMKFKLAKKLVELMSNYANPVYAIASDQYYTSDALLQRIGFRLDEINEQGRLYKWHKHSQQ